MSVDHRLIRVNKNLYTDIKSYFKEDVSDISDFLEVIEDRSEELQFYGEWNSWTFRDALKDRNIKPFGCSIELNQEILKDCKTEIINKMKKHVEGGFKKAEVGQYIQNDWVEDNEFIECKNIINSINEALRVVDFELEVLLYLFD